MLFKTYYALSRRSQMFSKIDVLKIWRPTTLLKRDSNERLSFENMKKKKKVKVLEEVKIDLKKN